MVSIIDQWVWLFWLFVSNKNSALTLTPTSNLLTLVHKSDRLVESNVVPRTRKAHWPTYVIICLSHIVLVVSPECWNCQWSDNEVTEGRVCVCKWMRERRPLKDSVQLMVSAPYLNNSPLHDKDFHSRTSSTSSTKAETTNPSPPSLPVGDRWN